MDFLEQRGLPLTEENLNTWQADLLAREQAAKDKNIELRQKRAEILREFHALKRQEELLFRKRAATSSKAWSRPVLGRRSFSEIVILINIIMFVLSRLFPSLTYHLALYGPLVLVRGQYYRFFTTMFMHGSILHIMFNMYALYILGDQLERVLGKSLFAVLYLGAGILGAALTYIVNPMILSVGASGAIFGLLGYVLYARVFRYSNVAPHIQSSLLTLLGVNLLIALLPGTNIDIWSHIGGLAGGFLIGMILGPAGGYLRSKKDQTTQTLLGILGIIAILAKVILPFLGFRLF